MAGILDRCIWLATGTGTGSFVESAAQTGFQTMESAGAVDGQTYPYVAQSLDMSQWEYGLGTWTAGSRTFARTTIYGNSLGGTTAINFNSIPQVLITLTAVAARSMWHGVMGGRLTLTSATPVLKANATAQTTVYYTPYLHNNVTCFDGINLANIDFTETSVTLDTTNFLSGKLYDFFIFLNGSAPTLGYGPAWTSITARSAATALTRVQGQWANNTTITLRTNSTTTFSIATNQAVYAGTCYATANGQTGMNLNPAAAAGGADPVLGVFNAYNRVPISTLSQDSTASWSTSSPTWRAVNNNANNSFNFVDGLGEVYCDATYEVTGSSDAASSQAATGVAMNWSSGAPTFISAIYHNTTANIISCTLNARGIFLPAMGFNTVSAIESALNSTSTSWLGNGEQMLLGTVCI